jgi:hypothetical protein
VICCKFRQTTSDGGFSFVQRFLLPPKENVANDLTNISTGSDNINYVKLFLNKVFYKRFIFCDNLIILP